MRVSTLLLALPALVAAQNQFPFADQAQAWFEKAKSFIPSTPPNPVEFGAAEFAKGRVHKFTHTNYEQKLKPTSQNPADGPEEWMVLVTGGNKTCFGRCGDIETSWNESIPILSALPKAPRLGLIDCDRQAILCSTWAAAVPSVYFFQVPTPAPHQSQPRTPLYIIPLNTTSTKVSDITSIVTERRYATQVLQEDGTTTKEKFRYDGLWHPINGQLKVFGLFDPLGYLMWGFSQIPSFVFMIVISFVSRNIMSRRAAQHPAGAGPGAAPAPAAGAGAGARPAGAAGAAKKNS